jgi:putative ABC transport system permease protein
VAHWAARVAAAAQPAQLAAQGYTILDWRVLGFAVALALLTGILFGVVPAILMGRTRVDGAAMRNRNTGQPMGASRLRMALLAMQGAFTLVLLAGSFTMGRSFLRLVGADLGFRTANVVTLNVSLSGTRWGAANGATLYYDDALARLRAVPGVESAAAVGYLPLMEYAFGATTLQLDNSHQVSGAVMNTATPDYFRTMSTRVLEGREFEATDQATSERVIIVNQEFARLLGIGPHLAGRQVKALFPKDRVYTIVGVVQSALFLGPGEPARPQIFFPAKQSPPGFATFVARVDGAVPPYLVVCRDAVQQVDRQVPVYDVKTLDQRLRDTLSRPRFYATAVLFFGGFALLLAVVGIYGVTTYAISQRTHEIGVRIAVGASPTGLRGMLLWQSLLPLACGVLLGIAGAAVSGQYLEHLIAGADSTGPWTCAVAATLATVAAAAVWTATGRVMRLDPMAALRAE